MLAKKHDAECKGSKKVEKAHQTADKQRDLYICIFTLLRHTFYDSVSTHIRSLPLDSLVDN